MSKILLKDMFGAADKYIGATVTLEGWIRNHRRQKTFGFIDFFDGSCFKSVQVVYSDAVENFSEINAYRVGSAIKVTGKLTEVENRPGTVEIQAENVELLGDCPENYPLQPKKHSLEFLREQAYLRPRTRVFQAVFKVRSVAAMAVHTYFQDRGYVYVHTPLISANDGEGAGNTFKVTTLADGETDHSKDFFGKETCLAVTGQLEGETFAMAFGKIYTFGPTFRAENSNTKTHAAEFWMIEPEVAFCDLDGLMDLEEDFLKFVVKYVLDRCSDELEFLQKFNGTNLIDKLNAFVESHIAKVTHHDAVEILKKVEDRFVFKPQYGEDIAKEHEKYLTEEYFKSPVFVYDWPKDIKAFYMYQNDDGKTVAAVDLLVPGAGELMGGSQRETDYDKLLARVRELGISEDDMYWYLNLRRFGGCAHSGFGMGFERLVMYLTDMENIRDVIPYYRTPLNCDF